MSERLAWRVIIGVSVCALVGATFYETTVRREAAHRSLESSYIEEIKNMRSEMPPEIVTAYQETLGLNTMLEILEAERPYCHSEAHNIGRAIYKEEGKIGKAIERCDRSCNDGCFHGLVMGVFEGLVGDVPPHIHPPEEAHTNPHVILTEENRESVTSMLRSICEREDVLTLTNGKQGDCFHALGHAAMFLASYDINNALELCSTFKDNGFEYYCATGAYMERNIVYSELDNEDGLLAPCLTNANFPSACFRYEIQELHDGKHASFEEVRNLCISIKDRELYAACYHGLGFGYHGLILRNEKNLETLCENEDPLAKRLCVEGAVGVMESNRYGTGTEACSILPPSEAEYCLHAASVRDFGMQRDFSLYYIKN